MNLNKTQTRHIILINLLLLSSGGCEDTHVSSNILKKKLSLEFSPAPSSITINPDPGAGYEKVILNLGPNFQAAQVCKGTTVLNLSGTAPCTICTNSLKSNLSRTPNATQLAIAGEWSPLPANVRTVPSLLSDDDGVCISDVNTCVSKEKSPVMSIPVSVHKSFAPCGNSLSSVALRAQDCQTINGAAATWNGQTQGLSGEATWKLVTVAANNTTGKAPYYEVWEDLRTGLLWSSRTSIPIPSPVNGIPGGTLTTMQPWCAATGNNSVQGTIGTADPAGACTHNLTSYCSETLAPISGITLAGTAYPGDFFSADSTRDKYDGAKGGMGAFSSPAVYWRLPTLNDYQQAEIDGIRFVLPDMGGPVLPAVAAQAPQEWTSTLLSTSVNRTQAFSFGSVDGTVQSRDRSTTTLYLRCVGRY